MLAGGRERALCFAGMKQYCWRRVSTVEYFSDTSTFTGLVSDARCSFPTYGSRPNPELVECKLKVPLRGRSAANSMDDLTQNTAQGCRVGVMPSVAQLSPDHRLVLPLRQLPPEY